MLGFEGDNAREKVIVLLTMCFALAMAMHREGHRAFKFAAVVSHEGIAREMAALRAALGPDAELLIDLHWKFTAD